MSHTQEERHSTMITRLSQLKKFGDAESERGSKKGRKKRGGGGGATTIGEEDDSDEEVRMRHGGNGMKSGSTLKNTRRGNRAGCFRHWRMGSRAGVASDGRTDCAQQGTVEISKTVEVTRVDAGGWLAVWHYTRCDVCSFAGHW